MDVAPCIYITLFFAFFNGVENSIIDYYVNLIKSEIARASTNTLPQDASEFIPHSNIPTVYGSFDYVIVGAGSAGAVIASRLSEIKQNQVLLLEAGGHETNFTDIPGMVRYLQNLEFNWNFTSTPQTTACLAAPDGECSSPRGKALGGSTVINFGLYSRGNKLDYDSWASEGNVGWSYEDVLPYFKKSENFQGDGDEAYHGKGGYLNVDFPKPLSPQLDAFIAGNLERGEKLVDYNGAEQLGVSVSQLNTIHGRRDSSAKAFLLPAKKRRNLKVLSNSFAIKVLILPLLNKAYGVLFSHEGKLRVALARKEVILSAGVIGSPQLLMLSGIGPKLHLQSLGIPVIQSLSVGVNYQDHATFFGIAFDSNYSEPFLPLEQNVENYLNGVGLLTVAGNTQGIGFYQTYPPGTPGNPDIELNFNPANNIDSLLCSSENSCNASTIFTLALYLLHPKSRGSVRLKSCNPYEYPLLDPNYYSDPEGEDIEKMYQGIQIALGIVSTNAFRKYNPRLILDPLPACQEHQYLSREFWYCRLRQLTTVMVHSAGTCKMGPDPRKGAVVNHQLKVHGVSGLRVADASIMPSIVAGHTSAPTVMIGEKVSDMIKMEHNN